MRKNGFSKPFSGDQVTSWAIQPLIVGVSLRALVEVEVQATHDLRNSGIRGVRGRATRPRQGTSQL
jgi:hypothetical protein